MVFGAGHEVGFVDGELEVCYGAVVVFDGFDFDTGLFLFCEFWCDWMKKVEVSYVWVPFTD